MNTLSIYTVEIGSNEDNMEFRAFLDTVNMEKYICNYLKRVQEPFEFKKTCKELSKLQVPFECYYDCIVQNEDEDGLIKVTKREFLKEDIVMFVKDLTNVLTYIYKIKTTDSVGYEIQSEVTIFGKESVLRRVKNVLIEQHQFSLEKAKEFVSEKKRELLDNCGVFYEDNECTVSVQQDFDYTFLNES